MDTQPRPAARTAPRLVDSSSIKVPAAGMYRVAFTASAGVEMGSVAITDVQLEAVPSAVASPLAHQETGSDRKGA